MKKCPRCGHDLKDDENFCSHCGLDLRNHYHHRKSNNKAMTYLLYVIIFFSFITIPLLYSRILSGMTGYETIQQNEKIALPAIEGEATALIASYDTLADFQNQFTNVDGIVEKIQQYEDSLAQKQEGSWTKSYVIQITNNYNIYYDLTYQVAVDEHTTLQIERSFDRAHSYNDEKITMIKNDITTFESLFLSDSQQQLFQKFSGSQDTTTQLMSDFQKRQDEFEKKKETLGHYGIGNYDGQSSFVVYPQQKSFQSKLTYVHTPQEYIDE